MVIIGWIVWAFVAFLAVTFPIAIYQKHKKNEAVQIATVVQTICFAIITIIFILSGWNKLHILWIAPLSFVIASILAYSIGWARGTKEPKELK